MWKRMCEPWLIAFTVVDMLVSIGIAQLLVNYLGWRWLGIDGQPFDANNSVFAYIVIGSLVWPIFLLMVWLIGGEMLRSLKHGLNKSRTQA